jgi:hypothetical protein
VENAGSGNIFEDSNESPFLFPTIGRFIGGEEIPKRSRTSGLKKLIGIAKDLGK